MPAWMTSLLRELVPEQRASRLEIDLRPQLPSPAPYNSKAGRKFSLGGLAFGDKRRSMTI
jgi:hypothetical protein